MKVYLFGGAETELGQVGRLLKLIEQTIKKTGKKQVLHIPFARIIASEPEWSGDWYHRHIHLKDVEYLNASNEADIDKADNPLIFISGGSDKNNLTEKIRSNPKLWQLVKNASHIIGESAGAKTLGEYTRSGEINSPIIKGLGIIKHTVIEPHYTQRNRQKLLEKEMGQSGIKYGIAIDSCTGIEFDLKDFPKKYSKIGEGLVEIKVQE